MTIDTTGLMPPQFDHTKTLLDSLYLNGFAIDQSETGTGKTFVAAAIAREMNRPVVVICPLVVFSQWEKILKIFGVKATLVNYEKLGRGNTKLMKWKKKQVDLMRPWDEKAHREMPHYTFPRNTLVIIDEGHRCKGADTTNSWMMIALADQGYRTLVSSATIATSPLEMKAIGFLTQLHKLYNFSDFCRLHGGEWTGRWGSMTFNATCEKAKEAMLALNEYFFNTRKCSSRLRAEDFGKQFPESHIVAECYDMGSNEAKINAVYDNMEAELARLEERSSGYKEHIFAIMMEARRHSELLKVPVFVDMIEDLFDEGKSVAVFVNFTETIEAILKRLEKLPKFKDKIGFIVGGQASLERQKDVDDFNTDKKRVILCNIAAGGIGISLHDLNGNFPRASLISPNYSAYQLVQALGRVWRLNGLTKSYQRVVFAAKTIEEKACRAVQFKVDNLSTLNDADLAAGVQLFS